MKLSAMCIRCLFDRQEEKIRDIKQENKKAAYMKEIASIIGSAQADASAPYIVYKINTAYKRYFGSLPNYEKEKQFYNSLMLSMEEELRKKINTGSRREILQYALNLARTANYIDFGATNNVSKEQLMELLDKAGEEELEAQTLVKLEKDLEKAENLVYLTDNCGEIVADKLLIEVMKKQYPQMKITVIVRGMPVLNDATLEDAKSVGLTELVQVIDNGNGVAGTQIGLLSEEARRVLGEADVIISKGQGNFETIHDCGLNIYYLFLCKCDWFSKRFGLEKLKGVFINEREICLKDE